MILTVAPPPRMPTSPPTSIIYDMRRSSGSSVGDDLLGLCRNFDPRYEVVTNPTALTNPVMVFDAAFPEERTIRQLAMEQRAFRDSLPDDLEDVELPDFF